MYNKRVIEVLEGKLCPYCGSKTKVVIGERGGGMMTCVRYPDCDSYTFIDNSLGVIKSLGRLANQELRFERMLSEHHLGKLMESYDLTRDEVMDSLVTEIGFHEPYKDIYYLKLNTCKIMTRLLVLKRMAMDYKHTKVYVNYSARKNHKGNLLRCIILWVYNSKETLVEFDDGYREKVTYIRTTR